jgi:monofunctional glycosyltransferase
MGSRVELSNLTVETSVPKSAKRGARSQGQAHGRLRLWLRRLGFVVLAIVLLPYLIAPLFIVINPPVTFVMLERAARERLGIHKTWVDFEDISPNLVRAVLASEDARFCSHHGIDWVEVQNALQDEDGPMRGASTVSMQTARNIFLPTGRSWVRKGLELPLALYIDFVLSKRRILEIYLNVAEWGTGVYGAGEAAKRDFGVSASNLTRSQSALLAAALPSPRLRNPARPGPGYSRIARRVAGRAAALGPAADCVLK